MNKKRLSVVMAGAMLASNVAPVLATEEVQNDVKTALKDLRVIDVVKLVNLGHTTVKEDSKDVIASKTTKATDTEAELEFDLDSQLKDFAKIESDLIDFSQKSLTDTTLKTSYNKSSKAYTIAFKIDINGDSVVTEDDKIEITTSSNRLNFNKYNTTARNTIDVKYGMNADFKSFPEVDAKKLIMTSKRNRYIIIIFYFYYKKLNALFLLK